MSVSWHLLHQCWHHMMPAVSLMLPLQSLDQYNQSKVKHYLFVHVMPLALALVSSDVHAVINCINAFLMYVPKTNMPPQMPYICHTHKLIHLHMRQLCQYICLIWTHCNQQCDQECRFTCTSHYWHMPLNKYTCHTVHVGFIALLL